MNIRSDLPVRETNHVVSGALPWLRKNALLLLVFSFVLVVSIWKWQLLWSSIVSLVLGVVANFLPDSRIHEHPFPSMMLLEYWVAALVWFVFSAVVIRNLVETFGRRNRNINSAYDDSLLRGKSSPGLRGKIWIVCGFLLVSAEAPLWAPFNPSSHGDLRTARLMMPFANGPAPANHESTAVPSGDATQQNIIVELYERAYHSLNDHPQETDNYTGEDATIRTRAAVTFFLGTDNLGRDVLSRLLYAMRISVIIGLCAMVLSLILGSLIGFVSGFSRIRFIDGALMRMVDLFLAVPSLFLIIAVVAFFGNSTLLLIFVLAGTGWMNVARMVRGEVLHIRDKEFILAARMLGRSKVRIVIDHLVPNILPTIIVASVLQLGNVILAEASLSFLGLGIQPPTPSLGNMIGESLAYVGRGWWVGVFPGLVLTLFVVSVNSLAENLQHHLEAGGDHEGGLP